jgi:hypothetical protein
MAKEKKETQPIVYNTPMTSTVVNGIQVGNDVVKSLKTATTADTTIEFVSSDNSINIVPHVSAGDIDFKVNPATQQTVMTMPTFINYISGGENIKDYCRNGSKAGQTIAVACGVGGLIRPTPTDKTGDMYVDVFFTNRLTRPDAEDDMYLYMLFDYNDTHGDDAVGVYFLSNRFNDHASIVVDVYNDPDSSDPAFQYEVTQEYPNVTFNLSQYMRQATGMLSFRLANVKLQSGTGGYPPFGYLMEVWSNVFFRWDNPKIFVEGQYNG